MSEPILDQGIFWWPSGLPGQEKVRVVFNTALQVRPTKVTCEDYETRKPIDIENVDIEQSGTRAWARYTAATLRLARSAQGRSFRWRAWGE